MPLRTIPLAGRSITSFVNEWNWKFRYDWLDENLKDGDRKEVRKRIYGRTDAFLMWLYGKHLHATAPLLWETERKQVYLTFLCEQWTMMN